MPAIITHHLFGEEAVRRLPADYSLTEEELLAFLLANQGSDPFAYCLGPTPLTIKSCRRMVKTMHGSKVVEGLLAAHDAVFHLPAQDQAVGRAFALGLLAHYLLDSEAHAFIGAQENALYAADASLKASHKSVHALIESELDTWMLWNMRHQTIADMPAWANLARTERVSRVGGALFSQVAWEAHEIAFRPDRYEQCLRDCEFVYRTVDPTGNRRGRILVGMGRLGAQHALLEAVSHSDTPIEDCPAANLTCHPWLDPLTGAENTTSFPDVFYNALEMWPALAAAFERGDADQLRALIRRDYQGNPIA